MVLEVTTATIEDAVECADLIYQSALETCKKRVPIFTNLLEEVFNQFYNDIYWHCICREESKIVGVAGIMFVPYKWNKNHLRAIETAFHADPKLQLIKKGKICMALFERIEQECVNRGVSTLTFGTVPELNKLGNWLDRKGFNVSEIHYIKEYKNE